MVAAVDVLRACVPVHREAFEHYERALWLLMYYDLYEDEGPDERGTLYGDFFADMGFADGSVGVRVWTPAAHEFAARMRAREAAGQAEGGEET